jgi:hypothetical protein
MRVSSWAWAFGLTLIGVALVGVALVGVATAAESYIDRVSSQTVRVYLKDDKGRVVVSVTNNSTETLDIDVDCTFLMGTAKAGSGNGTTSRLPPHRTDTLDIADRQTMPFNTARCDVVRAEK